MSRSNNYLFVCAILTVLCLNKILNWLHIYKKRTPWHWSEQMHLFTTIRNKRSDSLERSNSSMHVPWPWKQERWWAPKRGHYVKLLYSMLFSKGIEENKRFDTSRDINRSQSGIDGLLSSNKGKLYCVLKFTMCLLVEDLMNLVCDKWVFRTHHIY